MSVSFDVTWTPDSRRAASMDAANLEVRFATNTVMSSTLDEEAMAEHTMTRWTTIENDAPVVGDLFIQRLLSRLRRMCLCHLLQPPGMYALVRRQLGMKASPENIALPNSNDISNLIAGADLCTMRSGFPQPPG